MAIFIDDQATDIPTGSLADVLEAATAQLQSNRRVVVEVMIDGQTLTAEQLDDPASHALDDAEVRLYSADPRELAVATLMQIKEQLGTAEGVQSEAADLLQQDKAPEAMKLIGESLQLWQQAGQAVLQSAQLLAIDLDEQTFDDKPIAQLTTELLDQIRSLAEMIGAGDTLGLADALAYEWPETTQTWVGLVGQMITWIDE